MRTTGRNLQEIISRLVCQQNRVGVSLLLLCCLLRQKTVLNLKGSLRLLRQTKGKTFLIISIRCSTSIVNDPFYILSRIPSDTFHGSLSLNQRKSIRHGSYRISLASHTSKMKRRMFYNKGLFPEVFSFKSRGHWSERKLKGNSNFLGQDPLSRTTNAQKRISK